uniref:permeability factor 2-like n=1 Tax=Myxine glutinosa TaxID=7769 RepID=UPI00358EF309
MDNRTATMSLSLILCLSLLFTTFVQATPRLRCRCIETESHPRIRRLMRNVKIIAPSHRCGKVEVIATLKIPHPNEVCLNTNAPWVKRYMKFIFTKGQ